MSVQRLLASVAAVSCLLLSGCVTAPYKPVPDDYRGPLATFHDSAKPYGMDKADIFYVSQVDGHWIGNSRDSSVAASHGKGSALTTVLVSRFVPTRPVTIEIVGRTTFAAPIGDMTHTIFQVKGTISFTPAADRSYTVRGQLADAHSAIWLEDDQTHEVVDHKFEVQGSAALGFFDK